MSAPWCPGARIVDVGPGGELVGGPPRAVHHTTEGGSIDGAVATYQQTGDYPNLTIDYARDEVVQHLPATASSTALMHQGNPQTNKMGDVCVQIEWVGQAAQPFTAGVTAGPNVRACFDWLRSLGIPDVWPMGPPPASDGAYGIDNGHRDAGTWTTQAGHYTHSQVPGNYHSDAGQIDPEFIKQTAITGDDDMPSVADTQKLLDATEARINAKLAAILRAIVLEFHGDAGHKNSLDSLGKALHIPQ